MIAKPAVTQRNFTSSSFTTTPVENIAASSSWADDVLGIPDYLEEIYSWAYVHPRAVRVFERQWLVNLILLGNYRRLRDAALFELGTPIQGNTLQVACVYGDFTQQLVQRLGTDACLDVIDVLAVQLDNLRGKLAPDERVRIMQHDSTRLDLASASYDQALLFFLLHEQPEHVRRQTLAEAWRVVKPGGKIVVVDYHRPKQWHPLRAPINAVLRRLEPYALDLWAHPLTNYLPGDVQSAPRKETYFGGLYQKLVFTR